MFGVIFDFDGVLVDSISTVQRILSHIAPEFGVDLTPEEREACRHHPVEVQVRRWNALRGTHIDYRDVTRRYIEEESAYLKTHSILFPGAIPLLRSLKEKSVPLAIATSAPRKRVEHILSISKIDSFFDAVVAVEDVQNPKPSPEPYLLAAQKLGIPPARCVGIEDTLTGLRSIFSAGMKSVAILNEGLSLEAAANATLKVNALSELSYAALSELFT